MYYPIINVTEEAQDDLIDGDFTLYDDQSGGGLRDGPPEKPAIVEFLRVIFVIGLRIGFFIIQMASVPVENVYIIVYHNVIEIAVAILSFGLFGIFVSYGFVTAKYKAYWNKWDEFIASRAATGLCAVLVGTAQMSTFLVGRIHPMGAILLTILYCALFQPIIMYLVWTKGTFMKHFNDQMRDPGFTLVAYIPSTVVGLVGCLILGRRLVRVKDVDEFSIGNDHVTSSIAGYLLIIMGYAILAMPVAHDGIEADPNANMMGERVVICNLLALATGIVIANLLYYCAFKEVHRYWTLLRIVQGGIAGMMTISAATDFSGLWNIFVMAAVGAFLNYMLTLCLHNTAMEDWCNMTASHLVCAFLSAIIWPVFEGLFNKKLLWQILYTLLIVLLSTIFALIVFFILKAMGLLRNKYEVVNHCRALHVLDHVPDKKYLERLFMISETKTPHIIPGSSRRRYIPDDEGINIRDGPKPLTFEEDSITSCERVATNKECKAEQMEHVLFMKHEKKLTYPLSTPPMRTWITSGSGDYYSSLI